MQDGHAALRARLRFARVTGIQILHTVNRSPKCLVRVAEHDRVRTFARDAELELFLQCVKVHDVMDEKFASGQRDRLGEAEGGRSVRVAGHRRDWRNRFQSGDDEVRADVTRVQNVADAGEKSGNFRVEKTVGVRDDPIFIEVRSGKVEVRGGWARG